MPSVSPESSANMGVGPIRHVGYGALVYRMGMANRLDV